MHKNLQAVILAGGKGSRLRSVTKKIPKAMVLVNKTPFLEILINQIKKNGIKRILILTGYKNKIIKNYINKNKDKNIIIHNSPVKYLTLARIIRAKSLISDNFLLMYCDNYLINFKLKKILKIYKENKSKIVLSVVKKKKNQKGNIKLEGNKTLYKKKISSDYVEAGYMMINKSNLLKKKLDIFKKNTDFSKLIDLYSSEGNLRHLINTKGFLCIENRNLLKETINYFKNDGKVN
jgi:NDP-sugar pyrophosphorylase family protein